VIWKLRLNKCVSHTAAEGVVEIKLSDDGKRFAIVEINSQTDFAAKSTDFTGFVDSVTQAVLDDQPASVADIKIGGRSVEEVRKELVAKIGENIQVRRFQTGSSAGGHLAQYSHSGRIGVVTELNGGDETVAKDIAMHVAANNPHCIDESGVPAEMLEKEKGILMAEAAESGKPAEIIEKMVAGRMRKYLADITLVGQPFVKDPDQSVEKVLKAAGATVTSFHRLEVGEGIEKKVENFAEEVMAQVRGTDDSDSTGGD